MIFDRIAENAIREAIREGKFDNLPNAGQPLDFEDYFKAPEDLRAAYGLLKSANLVPEEVELMNQIAARETELANGTTASQREALRRAITEAKLRLALIRERV